MCIEGAMIWLALEDLKYQKISVLTLVAGMLALPYRTNLDVYHAPVALVLVIAACYGFTGWGDLYVWVLASAWVGPLSLMAVILTAFQVCVYRATIKRYSWPWAGLLIVSTFLLRGL